MVHLYPRLLHLIDQFRIVHSSVDIFRQKSTFWGILYLQQGDPWTTSCTWGRHSWVILLMGGKVTIFRRFFPFWYHPISLVSDGECHIVILLLSWVTMASHGWLTGSRCGSILVIYVQLLYRKITYCVNVNETYGHTYVVSSFN